MLCADTANFASLLTVKLVSQDINSLKDLSIRNGDLLPQLPWLCHGWKRS